MASIKISALWAASCSCTFMVRENIRSMYCAISPRHNPAGYWADDTTSRRVKWEAFLVGVRTCHQANRSLIAPCRGAFAPGSKSIYCPTYSDERRNTTSGGVDEPGTSRAEKLSDAAEGRHHHRTLSHRRRYRAIASILRNGLR